MCENSLRDVTINDCVLRRLSLCHYILDQAQVRTTDFSWGVKDLTQLWPPKQATQATHLHIRPKQKQKKQCVPEQERTNKPEVFFFSTFLQHLISTPNLSCSPHSSFFSLPLWSTCSFIFAAAPRLLMWCLSAAMSSHPSRL